MPRGYAYDFGDNDKFTKLDLSSEQKMHISALQQHIPSLLAAGALSQAYIVKFPNGLPHVLTVLKQGGYGTILRDQGRFVGAASLYPISAQAALLGAFTAMSIASGQYFLSLINSELKMMKLNLDKILEFLYGEKKAELMSEVSFIKEAYQNYSSIMDHEAQRAATIANLQDAKKAAMKDIEFYISDLDSTTNRKDRSGVSSLVKKAFQIKEGLELSMQLYGMSSVLEIYYAQNHEPSYIKYTGGEISSYINKCEKRALSSFSILSKRVSDFKRKLWKKVDKSSHEKPISELIDSLNSGEESVLRKSLCSALQAATQSNKYYLNNDRNIYLKAS